MRKYEITKDLCCGTCKHYRQHYINWGEYGFHALSYGHCVYPRCKPREINQTCKYYEKKTTQ